MFASIVVGTDGSDTARRPCARPSPWRGRSERAWTSSAPTSRCRPGACARRPSRSPATCSGWSTPREDVDATLREAAEESRRPGSPTETYARQGDPADAILDVAEERGADLIVVGNKGMTGAKRFLLGSVPNKVSHHAPCSVLIIRTT